MDQDTGERKESETQATLGMETQAACHDGGVSGDTGSPHGGGMLGSQATSEEEGTQTWLVERGRRVAWHGSRSDPPLQDTVGRSWGDPHRQRETGTGGRGEWCPHAPGGPPAGRSAW